MLCCLGAACFLTAGVAAALRQRRGTCALGEAIRFVRFVRAEVRSVSPLREDLFQKAAGERYRCLSFDGALPALDAAAGDEARSLFDAFCARIGTTDRDGQRDLCDEAESRLGTLLNTRRAAEEGKLRVHLALSVLGALGVFLLFL